MKKRKKKKRMKSNPGRAKTKVLAAPVKLDPPMERNRLPVEPQQSSAAKHGDAKPLVEKINGLHAVVLAIGLLVLLSIDVASFVREKVRHEFDPTPATVEPLPEVRQDPRTAVGPNQDGKAHQQTVASDHQLIGTTESKTTRLDEN